MGLALSYYGAPHAPGGIAAGYDVGWFAPTYKLLDEAWRSAKQFLGPVATRVDGSYHRIEVDKAAIDFWNISDDAGRGRKYGLVIVDEAAIASDLKTAWEQGIRPTLTDYKGAAFFFSTPKGLNFFYDLYQESETKDDWSRYTAASLNNPHLDPEELREAQASLPELVFAQEYLAQFVTFGAGLIKPDMLITGTPPRPLPVVLGVDLAISEREGADWTAIVALARDAHTGTVYLREAERHRCGFHAVLERIQDAAIRHNPQVIAIEQVQYQAAVVQELSRTTHLPVRGVRPDRDKLTRFMPLLTRFEQGQVRLDPAGIPAWFREELLSFPEGQHDDGADAASLAFSALSSQSTPVIATSGQRRASALTSGFR